MKHTSKLLSLILVLVLMLGAFSAFSITASAATTTGATGDCTWTFDDAIGTLTFSGTGAIPGYTLTARPDWYAFEAQIKKVVIESGITKVGNNAFNGCSVLSEVILPDTLTEIRNNVFYDCTNLSYVEYWGTTAPTLGMGVFNGCDNLLVVNVPTNYEGDAFTRGLNISKTLVASAATTTGTTGNCTWTFDDTTGTLTISGNGAIGSDQSWSEYVSSITSIVIEDGVTSIANNAFRNHTSLKTVTLSASVETIGSYAFTGCSSLKSVTLPASVTKIGSAAFYACSSLETVNYLGTSAPSMGSYVFIGCIATVVNVPVDYEGDTFGDRDVVKNLVPDEEDDEGCTHESFADGKCTACGYECTHENRVNGLCDDCGYDLYADVVMWSDTNNNGAIDEGESTYTAIKAVLASGGSYKLYRDYDATNEGNIYISDNVETTLDLNGKALSWTNYDRLYLLNATLTICDSSTEQNGSISSNLSVIECTIDGARLYITGGSFNVLGINSGAAAAVLITNGIAEISGGSFNGKSDGISVLQSGEVTISGGTFNGESYGIVVSRSSKVTISGGTFNGKTDAIHVSEIGKLTISGGTFSSDPTDYVAKGYVAELNNETEMYEITDLEDAMKKADKALEDAIKAVQDNLDAAKTELQNAIDTNEADIEDKLAKLDEAYKAADVLINSEIVGLKAEDVAIRQNIADLEDEMNEADKALENAIKAVQDNLDAAKTELQNAIDTNEADIEDKVAKLDKALAEAKAVFEKADADNKKELIAKIDSADRALERIIASVMKDLDDAKEELNAAIISGDEALDEKITALSAVLDSAVAVLETADADNKAELISKIDEAYESLDAAIKAVKNDLDTLRAELEKADADNKAALEQKDGELQTFVTVVCVIAVVSLVGSGALAVWFFVDKKKKS